MKILNITNNYKKVIKETVEVIKAGGLVVFPSDTVYGLLVDPTNELAVKKLLEFKNRWAGKAISVAVSDLEMAKNYVQLSDKEKNIYKNLLPGPFTLINKGKHKMVKGIEAENGTLGIRIPDFKPIIDLVKILGKPVTVTSANLSGRTPHYSVESFWKILSKKRKEMIDLLVDGGKLPKNKPSTVIDATQPELKVIRRGDLITDSATQTLISKSEKETEKIAGFILKKALRDQKKKPLVFALSGDLGCGKTVFSRSVGYILGVKDKITSPTFVIYNEYKLDDRSLIIDNSKKIKKFLHFDLYRITADYELSELRFFDLFKIDTISCIEWPENMGEENFNKLKSITNLIPINFKYINENTREIKRQANL